MAHLAIWGALLIRSSFASTAEAVDKTPEWITTKHATAETVWRATKEFKLERSVQAARLKIASDFCRSSVWLNGRAWLQIDPYCSTEEIDVTSALQLGGNRIEVVVDQPCGPAGIALSLDIKPITGPNLSIHSDSSWRNVGSTETPNAPVGTSIEPVVSLGSVRPELWGVGRRPIIVSEFENYEQWQQSLEGKGRTQPQSLEVADGFEIAQIRTAEKNEGSWVSMTFDSRGRLMIAREDQGFLRMTLDDSHRRVSKVEPIQSDLAECRGLHFRGETLFANANNSKGLYSLKISESGVCEGTTLLRKFEGGVGHGRNDLTTTPDNHLISIHGDSVDPPSESVFDRTPAVRTPRGNKALPAGYLIRADLSGQHWELICTGLRNPFGVDTLANGDAFTYDADNEFDMGMPWYRPTRFVQLVSGADYGYRSMSGKLPGRFADQPDFAPHTLHIGRGSPTAIMHGRSLKFPAPYDRAMFILDWTYGRVLAIHLAPRGTGYRAAAELFAQGRPLNVTDLAAGPDGAMYLITGGRKTQSGLFRIAAKRQSAGKLGTNTVDASTPHELQCSKFSDQRRALRESLESFHGVVDSKAIDAAWDYLADADPLVRVAARAALEKQPVSLWESRVLRTHADRGGMDGLLSLARVADTSTAARILDQLQNVSSASLSTADRFKFLRVLELCDEAAPDAATARRSSISVQLRDMSQQRSEFVQCITNVGKNDELRRRIGLALGRWSGPESFDWILDQLVGSSVQEDQLAGLTAIRSNLGVGSPAQIRRFFHALNSTSQLVGGQGLPGFRDLLRKDAIEQLNAEQKAELGKLLNDTPLVDPPLPANRPFVRKWTLDDLSSLTRSGGPAGDPQRGRQIFEDALCGRCHRSGLRGPAVGPDLTHVARRFSRRDILESVLSPSLSVAENYRLATIEMVSGQVHTGRVVSEGDYRSQLLKLNTNALRSGESIELDKREMASFRLIESSPMPQGLLDSFTLEQIRDLLEYMLVD